MSKRFVDTSGYRQAWRKLDPKLRAAFYWLQENCDAAGYWTIDLDHFKFECGYALDIDRLVKETGAVERHGSGALRMVDFIEVNYGALKEGYNPHKPALRALALRQNSSLNQASSKLEDEGEDEDEDNSKREERASAPDGFTEFYAAYPSKKAPGAARKAWAKLTPAERALCKPAIEAQVKALHFRGKDGNDFVPHPATWLNARRWEDEVTAHVAPLVNGAPKPLTKEEAKAKLEEVRKANGIAPGGFLEISLWPKECKDVLFK